MIPKHRNILFGTHSPPLPSIPRVIHSFIHSGDLYSASSRDYYRIRTFWRRRFGATSLAQIYTDK